ncbi:hypothetical protein [Halovalidus salilacus]|uniref:hypothetical protein n=1 Tax=Halovalidus salilacus TaxID=3075124 RepID=UPI00387DD425
MVVTEFPTVFVFELSGLRTGRAVPGRFGVERSVVERFAVERLVLTIVGDVAHSVREYHAVDDGENLR